MPELPEGADIPPALAAMIEQRRADVETAAVRAREQSIVALPQTTWREIQGRAATLGITVDLSPDRSELRLLAELPPEASPA